MFLRAMIAPRPRSPMELSQPQWKRAPSGICSGP